MIGLCKCGSSGGALGAAASRGMNRKKKKEKKRSRRRKENKTGKKKEIRKERMKEKRKKERKTIKKRKKEGKKEDGSLCHRLERNKRTIFGCGVVDKRYVPPRSPEHIFAKICVSEAENLVNNQQKLVLKSKILSRNRRGVL